MINSARLKELKLEFLFKAKTSRNTLTHKSSFYLILEDENGNVGIGECSPIFGLSEENEPELRIKLKKVLDEIQNGKELEDLLLDGYPSIEFALETALKDLSNGGRRHLFDSEFSEGRAALKINGLIWMGEMEFMHEQLEKKIEEGFKCIKIKVGSHDFQKELDFLAQLRTNYGNDLIIRLDANGAFEPKEALNKLEKLASFNIHSIEQPIKQGQWEAMSQLVEKSPIPIALDEELIGQKRHMTALLDKIRPHFIILKPSLLGGFTTCDEWIKEAEKRSIVWWATSFLESNIGLNAIAQWVSTYDTKMYQGLGTGQIYSNNISAPLQLDGENLILKIEDRWELANILH